ncbi:phytochelatin synthase family protein [Vibrio natriegens]|uniref:phytochelatin synthase family protein n=1 Tax=Vibrio natriegens TaxID=691 RepID=UPI0023D88FD8|nr:phytochelatin synthase family protein [Vibrio natriegens]
MRSGHGCDHFKCLRNRTPVFHKWTQTTVLHTNVKSKKQILGRPTEGSEDKDYGLQLHQFAELLSIHGAKVEVNEVVNVDTSIDKQKMLNALEVDGTYLVVNYARRGVGQKGGGHMWRLSTPLIQ